MHTTNDNEPDAAFLDAELRTIASFIDRAKNGDLTEDAAMDEIAHIVRRRPNQSGETYQKPWG